MGVGINLKKILHERGITIKQLSEISGVSVNTLYSITKRDSSRVDPVIMQKIADALLIPVHSLYDDIDWLRENDNYLKDVGTMFATLYSIYKLEETPTEIKLLIKGNIPDIDKKLDAFCASGDAILQASKISVFGTAAVAYTLDELELMSSFRKLNDNGIKVALDFMSVLDTNPHYVRDEFIDAPKSE